MISGDRRDIAGGLFLVVLGLFVAVYAYSNYPLGTVMRMGPGMVPTALGVILTGFGALVAVPACFRSGSLPELDIRVMLIVSASIAVFALLIRPFGVAPAVIALTIVASLANREFKPIDTALIAVSLATLTVGVFVFALGLPLRAFDWPF